MLDERAFGDEKQDWKRDGIRPVLRQEYECMKAAVKYIENGDRRASWAGAQLEHRTDHAEAASLGRVPCPIGKRITHVDTAQR